MLCQLSYTTHARGGGWTRTSDPWFPEGSVAYAPGATRCPSSRDQSGYAKWRLPSRRRRRSSSRIRTDIPGEKYASPTHREVLYSVVVQRSRPRGRVGYGDPAPVKARMGLEPMVTKKYPWPAHRGHNVQLLNLW